MTQTTELPQKGECLPKVSSLETRLPARSRRTARRTSIPGTSQIERSFEAVAREIGIDYRGLQGVQLYRDSQFEMLSRDADLTEANFRVAREAFNRAFDERIVLRFPDTYAATLARRRLANAAS